VRFGGIYMKLMDSYQAGVNLGGWISQYGKSNKEHFNNFIKEEDIKQISSWGMDHVRLPIDYTILEDDNTPYVYKEDGFNFIDRCIDWCKKYNLNIILDLHKAPGFSFSTLEKNTLFESEEKQQRFIRLWMFFAQRYLEEGDNVIFELMNEVVEPTSCRWNKLAHKAIEAIRSVDRNRIIIYGGNRYSSINMLKEIDVVQDPRVVYTFHFYLPFLFTHQKAPFNKMFSAWNKALDYPGNAEGFRAFMAEHPEFLDKYHDYQDENGLVKEPVFSKENMIKDVQPAIDFINNTCKEVYCGEYGVIDQATMENRIRWSKDFISIMKELKIGRSVWSYKKMDFGLVDENSKVINDELVKILSDR
jgi:endoglucanase